MTTLDLQALANQPGFGSAQSEIRRAGFWDEHAGSGTAREFTVYLTAVTTVSATLIVKARNRDEARDKAIQQVPGRWEVGAYGGLDDDEISAETILDSAELAT